MTPLVVMVAALAAAPLAATPSKETPPAASKKVLPFIEDDWDKALAEAKAKNVPIFIEAWAPW